MHEQRAWSVCVALDVYKYQQEAGSPFNSQLLTCAPPILRSHASTIRRLPITLCRLQFVGPHYRLTVSPTFASPPIVCAATLAPPAHDMSTWSLR